MKENRIFYWTRRSTRYQFNRQTVPCKIKCPRIYCRPKKTILLELNKAPHVKHRLINRPWKTKRLFGRGSSEEALRKSPASGVCFLGEVLSQNFWQSKYQKKRELVKKWVISSSIDVTARSPICLFSMQPKNIVVAPVLARKFGTRFWVY